MPTIIPIAARRAEVTRRLREVAGRIDDGELKVTAADLADLILDGSIDRETLTAGETLARASVAECAPLLATRLRKRADEIEGAG